MAQRQQLLAIHSMLDHVAGEAARARLPLVATLSAAAAEAAREEIALLERRSRRPTGDAAPLRRKEPVIA